MTEVEALRALVDKITEIENDDGFNGIWGFCFAHGYVYDGPSWKKELDDARLILAGHEK